MMNIFLSLLSIPLAAAAVTGTTTGEHAEMSSCSTEKVASAEIVCSSEMKDVKQVANKEGSCATECASKASEIVNSTTTGSGSAELQVINVDYKAQGDQQTIKVVAEKSGSYDLGDVVSPFTALHAQSGSEKSLSDVAGSKATVVIFWNQNCPYVEGANGAASSIAEFADKYKDQGVSVVAIDAGSNNSPDTITEYAKSKSFPVFINADSTLAAKFNATYTPNTFILDKDMKLVYKGAFYTGSGDSRVIHAENATKEILEGKTPTVTSTTGVGCSIKWAGGKKPTI